MHWFLTEQREEVSSMSALLAVAERAAETNLLLAEEYLVRNAVAIKECLRQARHLQPAARFRSSFQNARQRPALS